MELTTKITYKYIRGHKLTFVSDSDEGKLLDTKVYLNSDVLLCVIEGSKIEDFFTDFCLMINHYHI